MTETTLYRFWGVEGLLYVGISVNAYARAAQHRRGKDWWPKADAVTFEYYLTREAALEAEELAIKYEGPLYNIVHNPAHPARKIRVVVDDNEDFPELMSASDVARMLRVSDSTVDRLRRQGGFAEPMQIDGACYWSQESIDAWIDRELEKVAA